MSGRKYVGLTQPQANALHALLAIVLNDPDFPMSRAYLNALSGAAGAIAKIAAP